MWYFTYTITFHAIHTLQVVKEKEQLAGIDKQKETLMASETYTTSPCAQHYHNLIVTYPLLKNKKTWTSNSREYCSATTEGHPCTNLLDGTVSCGVLCDMLVVTDDPCSLWIMPGAGAYNWVWPVYTMNGQ